MNTSISDLLRARGPSLSSDLIAELVKSGISPAAARQRITRAGPQVVKLAGLRFEKNARFIYLDGQFGDKAFWLALERAFASNGKAYWGAVVGLKARGGRCPKSLFPIVCGAPLQRKGQLSPERILERLIAINLLQEEQSEKLGEPYITFKPGCYAGADSAVANAHLLAEFVALQAVKDWAKKMGFGSYDSFKVRGGEGLPVVSSVAWDLSAPSYIRPLTRVQGGKLIPGFFVCDINLYQSFDEDQLELYLRKYSMASAPVNVAPIMPVLVADYFTDAAFDKAKQKGLIAVTIENLFGAEVARALNDLISLLSDAGATAAVNPEHLERVITELTRIEGAANNLRGALFELVIGNLVKEVEGGFLQTGIEMHHFQSGRKMEVDVILDLPDKASTLIVECKAKIPGSKVGLKEVKKWFTDRIPLIVETLLQDGRYIESRLRFELWTNGDFHPSALDWLEQQPSEHDHYSVSWKDRKSLKSYAHKAKNKSIKNVLREHYFNNPLVTLNNGT